MERPSRAAKGKPEETTDDEPTARTSAEPSDAGGADPLRPLREGADALRTDLQIYANTAEGQREATCRALSSTWLVHQALVDEFVWPASSDGGALDAAFEDRQIDVDLTKILILALAEARDDAERASLMRSLARRIGPLLDHELAPETGLFARAKPETSADLAARIQTRRAALERHVATSRPMLARLSAALPETTNRQETNVMRSSNMRERDDQGRFMSDDDRRDRGEHGGYETSRRRQSHGEDRDEYGRFTSSRDDHEDRDDRGLRGRNDDSRYAGREASHRGWYGDREGHAEAAREGWSGRHREEDRDDHGRFTSRRDSDDRESHGNGHGGWFDDREGHREAARERARGRSENYDEDRRYSRSSRDDDRRGVGRFDPDDDGRDRRGWYGDREGHAEAAREGWRTRHHDDDDDDRRSRGRDDGRDEHSGGWFGDPRGHAEAFRRGWQNRR